MKGRLRKLVLFVLLGAIVNVAVAWGCALGLPLLTANGPASRSSTTGDRARYWIVEQLERPGAVRYVWIDVPFNFGNVPGLKLDIFVESEPVDLDGLPRWSRLDYSKPPPQKYRGWGPIFIDDARGWPLLAMSSFSALGVDPVKDAYLVRSSDGFSVPDSLRSQRLFAVIEEVIVYARKRAENVQDVPQSVSTFHRTDIENAIARDILDLENISPNLIIDRVTAAPGAAAILMRVIRFQVL